MRRSRCQSCNAIIAHLSKYDLMFNHFTQNHEQVQQTQTEARLAQIEFLQARLVSLTGALFLEFNIPRMGRRIDAVLLVGPVVFVIEFKVGETTFDAPQ